MIYKYYPPTDNTFDALIKKYFFFNKAAKQNDPFDTSFSLLQSKIMLEALGYDQQGQVLIKSIMGGYGSCCFAERCDNKHLWSFYAANYAGLVIGYDDAKFKEYSKFLIRIPYLKVDYISKPITDEDLDKQFKLDAPLYNDGLHEIWSKSHTYRECLYNEKLQDLLFTHLCSIKEKETWAIEEEYRLIAALDVMRPENQNRLEQHGFEYLDAGVRIPMPKDCVQEIIVGHNFDWGKYGNVINEIAQANKLFEIKQTRTGIPFNIEFEVITNQ